VTRVRLPAGIPSRWPGSAPPSIQTQRALVRAVLRSTPLLAQKSRKPGLLESTDRTRYPRDGMSQPSLRGFGVSGFRSFGGKRQRVGPMSKVHLLAGPNNSGKSNVLAVLEKAIPSLRTGRRFELDDVDIPQGASGPEQRRLRISVLSSVSESALREVVGDGADRFIPPLRQALSGPSFEAPEEQDYRWFELELAPPDQAKWTSTAEQINDVAKGPGSRAVSELSAVLTNTRGSQEDDAARVLGQAVDRLKVRQTLPEVVTLAAFRQIARPPPRASSKVSTTGDAYLHRGPADTL
jgi:hypothetical protein